MEDIKYFIIAHYIHFGEFPSKEKIEEFAKLILSYSSTLYKE